MDIAGKHIVITGALAALAALWRTVFTPRGPPSYFWLTLNGCP